jgi:lipopolysaccharide/colanic/teichoic acid biosynthesis glycosyltransferase
VRAILIVIKLTSMGSAIYKNKHAGTRDKIFDFYKFRSMCIIADRSLSKLSTQNRHANKDEGTKAGFVKIKDNRGVTKASIFLRNSGLYLLLQLLNIFRSMSLVDNRVVTVKYPFWLGIKIMIRRVPAMFQKERA